MKSLGKQKATRNARDSGFDFLLAEDSIDFSVGMLITGYYNLHGYTLKTILL